jgi:hypothetical protein
MPKDKRCAGQTSGFGAGSAVLAQLGTALPAPQLKRNAALVPGRMTWRLLALLSLSLVFACEQTSRVATGTAAARPGRSVDDLAGLEKRIGAALAETDQRLRSMPILPGAHEERPCPDGALPSRAAGEGPAELVVRAVDARAQPKHLLPLEIIVRLETDDFVGVVRHLRGGRAALWDPTAARPLSREAGEAALGELDRLRAAPLVAQVQILEYTPPHLFIRKGALRYQWDPGSLAFDLLVYDLSARKAVCQAPAVVRGDASNAPIRRRLREQTRLSLQRQLADRAWVALGDALGRISSHLALPDPTLRAAPSQRFSLDDRLAANVNGS